MIGPIKNIHIFILWCFFFQTVHCMDDSKKAIFTLITGPVQSGKTTLLFDLMHEAQKKEPVIMFRHSGEHKPCQELQTFSSRGNSIIQGYEINNCKDIFLLASKHGEPNVVGIDNIQFFNENTIRSVVNYFRNKKKKVFAAGLDLDFRGEPFGCIPALFALSDVKNQLQALCAQCGKHAAYSQRLCKGKATNYDLMVSEGEDVKYEPRCANCFQKPQK